MHRPEQLDHLPKTRDHPDQKYEKEKTVQVFDLAELVLGAQEL